MAQRKITTGIYTGGHFKVIDGLADVDRGVVSGQPHLQGGDRVEEEDREVSPLYLPEIESSLTDQNLPVL